MNIVELKERAVVVIGRVGKNLALRSAPARTRPTGCRGEAAATIGNLMTQAP